MPIAPRPTGKAQRIAEDILGKYPHIARPKTQTKKDYSFENQEPYYEIRLPKGPSVERD